VRGLLAVAVFALAAASACGIGPKHDDPSESIRPPPVGGGAPQDASRGEETAADGGTDAADADAAAPADAPPVDGDRADATDG
jgi:hypothetical protein